MEDLGVRDDERVLLVTSDIDGGGKRGETGCLYIEMVNIGGGQNRQGQNGDGGIEIGPEI